MGKRKGSRKSLSAGKKHTGRKQTGRRQARRHHLVAVADRRYKDTVFRMLFREKDRLLSLYNGVSGKHYTDPEGLEIVTLENAVYLGMKNDLAFLMDFSLYLYEHQSTVNPNMPFRFLQYVTDEYSRLTASDNLYGERLIRIPAPHFVVFYNGTRAYPEKKVLRLSDAFQVREGTPDLELKAQVLNINAGFNEDLKKQCRTLAEYMHYVDKVRMYARNMPIGEAVGKAVDECIEQGILREFLLRNKAEVMRMSIYEYDEESTRKAIRDTAYERGMEDGEARGYGRGVEDGEAKGKQTDILWLLEDIGPVPGKLQKEIMEETDRDVLAGWLKAAARAESIEDFTGRMGR